MRRSFLRFVVLLAAIFSMVAGSLGFSPSLASADGSDKDVCYTEITQHKYQRATTRTEYKYVKYTQTRTSQWSARGGWSSWSDWGPWTPWGSGNDHLTWSDQNVEALNSPAYHGSGNEGLTKKWERQWQLRNTGVTREVPGTPETTGWLTSPPSGDGWQVINTRSIRGDNFPCPEASATPGNCDNPGVITKSESAHYTWAQTGDDTAIVLTATPATGVVFGSAVQKVFGPFDISQLSGDPCPDETYQVIASKTWVGKYSSNQTTEITISGIDEDGTFNDYFKRWTFDANGDFIGDNTPLSLPVGMDYVASETLVQQQGYRCEPTWDDLPMDDNGLVVVSFTNTCEYDGYFIMASKTWENEVPEGSTAKVIVTVEGEAPSYWEFDHEGNIISPNTWPIYVSDSSLTFTVTEEFSVEDYSCAEEISREFDEDQNTWLVEAKNKCTKDEIPPPVEECPEGQIGTPPNCKTPPPPPVEECPEGQVGTPPNCKTPPPPPVEECPEGQIGTPPNCETPELPPPPVKECPTNSNIPADHEHCHTAKPTPPKKPTPPASTPKHTLPVTGSNSSGMISFGVGLLAVGCALLFVRRHYGLSS